MLGDYDSSQGVRGRHVQRLAEGSNVVVLSPDLAEMLSDSKAVNNTLRLLVDIANRSVGKANVGYKKPAAKIASTRPRFRACNRG